jgi:hypothetical protein
LAAAKQVHADLFEVVVRQIVENSKVDVVFGKALGVLPETELVEPVLTCPIAVPSTRPAAAWATMSNNGTP